MGAAFCVSARQVPIPPRSKPNRIGQGGYEKSVPNGHAFEKSLARDLNSRPAHYE